MAVSDTAERLKERLTSEDGRRERRSESLEQRLESAKERLEPALERFADTLESATERLLAELEPRAERARESVAQAVANAPQAAERVAERGRATAEQVGAYLGERIDEETMEVWGPRVLVGLVGFLVGFILGRFMRRRHETEDLWVEPEPAPGLAQAPPQDVRVSEPIQAAGQPG